MSKFFISVLVLFEVKFDTIHNIIKSFNTTTVVIIHIHYIYDFESVRKITISRILLDVYVGFVIHQSFVCMRVL